jgi:hypothetical protein
VHTKSRRHPYAAPSTHKAFMAEEYPKFPATIGALRESWAKVGSAVGLEPAGVLFFKRIFEIAPQALPMFSFKDEPDVSSADLEPELVPRNARHPCLFTYASLTPALHSSTTPPNSRSTHSQSCQLLA